MKTSNQIKGNENKKNEIMLEKKDKQIKLLYNFEIKLKHSQEKTKIKAKQHCFVFGNLNEFEHSTQSLFYFISFSFFLYFFLFSFVLLKKISPKFNFVSVTFWPTFN